MSRSVTVVLITLLTSGDRRIIVPLELYFQGTRMRTLPFTQKLPFQNQHFPYLNLQFQCIKHIR